MRVVEDTWGSGYGNLINRKMKWVMKGGGDEVG
jgi:hypothetical protein